MFDEHVSPTRGDRSTKVESDTPRLLFRINLRYRLELNVAEFHKFLSIGAFCIEQGHDIRRVKYDSEV